MSSITTSNHRNTNFPRIDYFDQQMDETALDLVKQYKENLCGDYNHEELRQAAYEVYTTVS